ncbi:hypothetical protein [Streptomyces turgidiscabies]|uniref:DNA-directed RNA polymerase specialized sigma24 family protein n=1 Tax=Streptomyces turgidiscabies TaxID=85558 RepID=A0ABU0RTR2_9ACTN|nr:hypothetical protein [Streptomyces turgidiscabies]MDQ0935178.1 DNA-directed RNA polymerase specialized sigma24 family protein [Streptomyces turgidiscabies]
MTEHRRAAATGRPAPAVALARHRMPMRAGERAERAALAAYAVFRERHYEPYLQYAALRIGQHGAAESAVAAAFTELAVSWTAVLGSAGPAAVAWRILHDHIDLVLGQHLGHMSGGQVVRTLRRDVQLLHQQLHLSCDRIAEVLGVPPDQVPGLLPRSSKE